MSKYSIFKSQFEKAIKSTNRNIEDLDLVAVSKKKSVQEIQAVIDENHKSFGENQIQEIESKWPDLKKNNPEIKLHFVGSIQSRKVESIYNNCDVIHSIDRLKILRLFNELENTQINKKKYFIQINTGN